MPPKACVGGVLPPKACAGGVMPPKAWAGGVMPPKAWAGGVMPPKACAGGLCLLSCNPIHIAWRWSLFCDLCQQLLHHLCHPSTPQWHRGRVSGGRGTREGQWWPAVQLPAASHVHLSMQRVSHAVYELNQDPRNQNSSKKISAIMDLTQKYKMSLKLMREFHYGQSNFKCVRKKLYILRCKVPLRGYIGNIYIL